MEVGGKKKQTNSTNICMSVPAAEIHPIKMSAFETVDVVNQLKFQAKLYLNGI